HSILSWATLTQSSSGPRHCGACQRRRCMASPAARSACDRGASDHSTPRINGTTPCVSWKRVRSTLAEGVASWAPIPGAHINPSRLPPWIVASEYEWHCASLQAGLGDGIRPEGPFANREIRRKPRGPGGNLVRSVTLRPTTVGVHIVLSDAP